MDFSKAKGSNLLKNVALKNQDMDSRTDLLIRELPCEQLLDNPQNEYLFGMTEADIEHMAEGIRENGFQGVVEVFSDGKQYELYSGHIRKYGAVRAGLKKIPAIVKSMPEETVKRRLLLGANLYGRNKVISSNPILTGRQLEYHKQTLVMEGFKGNMRAQLAKEFGISEAQVHRYMAILALNEELQETASAGIVPFTLLSEAKNLTDEEQNQLADKIHMTYYNTGEALTSRTFKALLDGIRGERPIEGQMNLTDMEPETFRETVSPDRKAPDMNQAPQSESVQDISEEDTLSGAEDETEPVKKEVVRDEQLTASDKDAKSKEPYPKICFEVYRYLVSSSNRFVSKHALKEFLVKNYGRPHTGGANSVFRYQCSIRGIQINSFDEITWDHFLEKVAETDVRVLHFYPEDRQISEIERTLYRAESQISQGALDHIEWSNPKEARNILKSLAAMLEDEIDHMADAV